MSTFRYRLAGVSPEGLDLYIEAGSGSTTNLFARPPWTEVTLVDDTREPDLDEWMSRLGYVPDSNGPVVVVTANHVMGTESIVLVDASGGALQVDVPLTTDRLGDEIVIMKIDATANAVSVTRSGADTIDGLVVQLLAQQGSSIRLLADEVSTNWHISASRRSADIVFDPGGSGLVSTNVRAAILELAAMGGGSVSTTITQPGHGLTTGEAIYFDGVLWQRAQANDEDTLATHLVSSVLTVNAFVATQAGLVGGLAGLTPGAYYFTSATIPGALVVTDPSSSTPGFFSNPMLLAVTATTAWVVPWRAYGFQGVGAGGTFVDTTTTLNAVPVTAQTLSFPTPGSFVAIVETRVVAKEQAPNTDKAAYRYTFRVNVDAGLTTVSTLQNDYTSEDDGTWDVLFTAVGSTVVVEVMGDLVNTVDWRVSSTVQVL